MCVKKCRKVSPSVECKFSSSCTLLQKQNNETMFVCHISNQSKKLPNPCDMGHLDDNIALG